MAVVSFFLGREAVCYYHKQGKLIGEVGAANTDVSVLIDQWLADTANIGEADNVMDVNLSIDSDMVDATTRGTAKYGFSSQIPVLKKGEANFDARWLPGAATDTFSYWLFKAWQDFGRVGLVFLDFSQTPATVGAKVGAGNHLIVQGLAANFSVSLGKSEGLKDIQKASIKCTIADSGMWKTKDVTGT